MWIHANLEKLSPSPKKHLLNFECVQCLCSAWSKRVASNLRGGGGLGDVKILATAVKTATIGF